MRERREERKRRERGEKGGKVHLELVSLLLLSGVQGRDVAIHHCHCSLLRCLHKLAVNLGKQKHTSYPDFHQPGNELLLTLKRERSRKSLCAVVSVGSSRDDWSSSFQSRSCPRICSSGAAFSATPTHTQQSKNNIVSFAS